MKVISSCTPYQCCCTNPGWGNGQRKGNSFYDKSLLLSCYFPLNSSLHHLRWFSRRLVVVNGLHLFPRIFPVIAFDHDSFGLDCSLLAIYLRFHLGTKHVFFSSFGLYYIHIMKHFSNIKCEDDVPSIYMIISTC